MAIAPGESLLSVLRERLRIVSVKDGCAPQGQCGCCTVLVDGEPRVACVTPATRVVGRSVTTVEGIDPGIRDALVGGLTATGGSQCGFCTPGIMVRLASAQARGKTSPADRDRALAAHLCRCTGWQTVLEALASENPHHEGDSTPKRERAALEGGGAQDVGPNVPLGQGGFADDTAPRDALVAVPLPPGSAADAVEAAGMQWVVAESLLEARARAGKVQGRRTTVGSSPPLAPPGLPAGGVRLATSWVEPAYLEPDASWCAPGGEPADPLANAGAFGGKESSPVPRAARELADVLGRPVRALYSREDVVRHGPKRAPIAASAVVDGDRVVVRGGVARDADAYAAPPPCPYTIGIDAAWEAVPVAGPPVVAHPRFVLADRHVLVEGALAAAGVDRSALVTDGRAAATLLDTCARADSGATAGARVLLDTQGRIEHVALRIAAGDPLDTVVLRSYAIGAAHMALGWVFTEALTVDPDTGEVFDLTIRSFGVIPARNTPAIAVELVDDPGPPLARASDAVFAAVASAAWNAVTAVDGTRPEQFPARDTAAGRALGR